MTNCVIKTFI